MTDLGKAFRVWRAENGMLLIHASTLMGVPPSTLSSWETGRDPWPNEMSIRVERLLGFRNFTPTPKEPKA